jgi:hypothetical protein
MSGVVTNRSEFERDLDKANQDRVKAAITATKVEGFRHWKLFRAELEEGAPGGQSLAAMREVSQWEKWIGRRRRKKYKPLSGLSKAVRYKVDGKGQLHMEIGAVDTRAQRRDAIQASGLGESSPFVEWAARGLSSSWVSIFNRQQSGTSVPVTAGTRELLASIGGKMVGKRYDSAGEFGAALGVARYFFLRKSTTQFQIPPRDIVDTYWRRHSAEAMPHIQSNYERKLRGERI